MILSLMVPVAAQSRPLDGFEAAEALTGGSPEGPGPRMPEMFLIFLYPIPKCHY